jgi:hypothetical protein
MGHYFIMKAVDHIVSKVSAAINLKVAIFNAKLENEGPYTWMTDLLNVHVPMNYTMTRYPEFINA